MSYTLIIKGDESAAWTACRAHDIEVTSIVRHTQFDECILTTPSRADSMTVLNVWFCEHNGIPPAPAGTLMWFGPVFNRQNGTPVVPPKGWDIIKGGKEDNNHA
jgi:hypothetical protein